MGSVHSKISGRASSRTRGWQQYADISRLARSRAGPPHGRGSSKALPMLPKVPLASCLGTCWAEALEKLRE